MKSNTLSNILHDLESKRNLVHTILSQIGLIRKHASNFQTFIGIKEIEKITGNCNVKFQEMYDQGKFNDIEVKVEKALTKKPNFTAKDLIGNIKVSVIPNTMTVKTRKVSDAHLMTV